MSALLLPFEYILATILRVARHQHALRPVRDELAFNLDQRVAERHAFNRQSLVFVAWQRARKSIWPCWGLGKRLHQLLDDLEVRQTRGEIVAAHHTTEPRLRAMLVELDARLARRAWPARLVRRLRR